MIVNKIVLPRYSIKGLDIPQSCPLSPANDQYAAHEAKKRRLGSKWMCSVSGKTFDEEKDLDAHLEQSHPAPKVKGCLADYCDILRCEPYFHLVKTNSKCDDNDMAELKLKCMNMVRDQCAPEHLSPKDKLQVEVSVQASVCSYLTCDMYWTVPEEEVLNHETYYYATYAVALLALIGFLYIYFKIASSNLDNSKSIEQILAEADKYEKPKPQIIPPDSNMEIRHRNPTASRQWSEQESW